MELLLSQERVVTLLYERAFPPRPDGAVVPVAQAPPLEATLEGGGAGGMGGGSWDVGEVDEEAIMADSLL